ncbi:ABC transporter permease [Streptomyces sp. NPDC101175]|uniref:ABC transporter permease n=1 Tax=Streptomyces sp. NPDC101175 TaxID=3366123 RepID=UPI003833F89E
MSSDDRTQPLRRATARHGRARTAQVVRLGPVDLIRVGVMGLRMRKVRALLSALGISVGVATLVLVTAVPASSQQALLDRLTALGTDRLKAQPLVPEGQKPIELPSQAADMAAWIGPVTATSEVANTHRTVRRTEADNPDDTAALTVLATRPDLLDLVGGSVRTGHFIDAGTAALPRVVLGYQAARTLGFDRLTVGADAPLLRLGDRWFTVTGILDPMPLDPDLELSVFVGWSAARRYLGFDGHPTVVYAKAPDRAIDSVKSVLAATVYPPLPSFVSVTNPSDALKAQRAARSTYSTLYVALAGIALAVGGIGVANTMYISVLERRREIGLRRALGAGRGHIRGQFLTESVVLTLLGACGGAAIGTACATAYAVLQGWPVVIPLGMFAGGVGAALAVGVLAGVYPAVSASRLTPTEALATT